jgi:Zn-dependent protease with chaperone function
MSLFPLHVSLLIAGLAIATGVAACSLWCAQSARTYGDRRTLLLLSLAAPMLVGVPLGASVMVMWRRGCPLFTPADGPISFGLLAVGAVWMLTCLLSQLQRTWKLRKAIDRVMAPTRNRRIVSMVRSLAKQLGVTAPAVACCQSSRPLACIVGVRRPVIVLSSWVIDNMNDSELEAILAHELAHHYHRDNLVTGIAAWLERSLGVLPPARRAWTWLQADREIASDALASRMTGRPLDLATALVKMWEHGQAVGGPKCCAGSAFAAFPGAAEFAIEERVQRLTAGFSAKETAQGYGRHSGYALILALALVAAALLPLALMPGGPGEPCPAMVM